MSAFRGTRVRYWPIPEFLEIRVDYDPLQSSALNLGNVVWNLSVWRDCLRNALFAPLISPRDRWQWPHHQASLHIFAKVSLRSRHLEVVSTKENGCARRRHACFPGVRPFSLSPTTSKHLLRRPAKVVADSFHNLVYRAATKTCYEDKLLFRNVYFVATGEKCRKLALKSCIIKSIILPTQHNFEHKTSVSWAT